MDTVELRRMQVLGSAEEKLTWAAGTRKAGWSNERQCDTSQRPCGSQPWFNRPVPPFSFKAGRQSGSANKEVAANGKSDEGDRPNLLENNVIPKPTPL